MAPNKLAAKMRRALVRELRQEGAIRSRQVAAAFATVPRHRFVPTASLTEAYENRVIATKEVDGEIVSSLSQPAMMAIMLEQLKLRRGQRVLEIGTGTGYNAALIAEIVGPDGRVVTIDIEPDLVALARQHLAVTGYHQVTAVTGDGAAGHSEGGPYDRIVLTAAASDIAAAWWEQLAPGGRLVLPLALREPAWQMSVALQDRGEYLAAESLRPCRFITMRGPVGGEPLRAVPFGLSRGLYLRWGAPTGGPGQVDQWLAGDHQDHDTGVLMNWQDYWDGLRPWLGLQLPAVVELIGTGPALQGELLPPFLYHDWDQPTMVTLAILGTTGLAALARPAGASDPRRAAAPFVLTVREYGQAAPETRQLLDAVAAWQATGRPSIRRLRLRALRAGRSHEPAPGDLVIQRPETTFILNWQN